jgi:glycosyltransferase involved in cell wall biosynthesis
VIRSPVDTRLGGRLVVVSHTEHHRRADGTVTGLAPTVRELDELAPLFDEVLHLAHVHPGEPPASQAPYGATNVSVVPLVVAGGSRPRDKAAAAACVPTWARAVRRAAGDADWLHLRLPCAVGMVGVVAAAGRMRRVPTWVKYAGAWHPTGRDPHTYRVQRSLCRHLPGPSAVTVSWAEAGQERWVRTWPNPCLDDDDLAAGERLAAKRVPHGGPLGLVFVGRLDAPKGFDIALDAVRLLRAEGHDVRLTAVGDGPLGAQAAVAEGVEHVGWTDRAGVRRHLADAHLLLLPSASEGFPKVVAEALSHRVVPVVSDLPVLRAFLGRVGTGTVVGERTGAGLARAVAAYADDPERWTAEADAGLAVRAEFSYAAHRERVRALFEELGRA